MPVPSTLFVITAIALSLVASAATAAPIDGNAIRVLDGDTLQIAGKSKSTRLVGFNAPETRGAACDAEHSLGQRAKKRLAELVNGGRLDIKYVPCSCSPGTEGTLACNYGRSCSTLTARGVDVGATLIAEGLAVSFKCSHTRCAATSRPWCD